MEEIKLVIGARRTQVIVYEDVDYGIPKDAIYKEKKIPIKDQNDKEQDNKEQKQSPYSSFNYYQRLKKRRETLKELVYNNFVVPNISFLTLTFNDAQRGEKDYTDLATTHREFKNFILRMNRRYSNFKYVGVFARQKTGNWHYHLICNLDHTTTNKEIEAIWKRGYVWIEYIKANGDLFDKVTYCIRNMQEVGLQELQGEKGYLCSKSLQRNIVLRTWKENEIQECKELFEDIRTKKSKLLYTSEKVQGVKAETVNQETGEILYYYDNGKMLNDTLEKYGYEEWKSTFYHISSTAKYPERFKLLECAKKIEKTKQFNFAKNTPYTSTSKR